MNGLKKGQATRSHLSPPVGSIVLSIDGTCSQESQGEEVLRNINQNLHHSVPPIAVFDRQLSPSYLTVPCLIHYALTFLGCDWLKRASTIVTAHCFVVSLMILSLIPLTPFARPSTILSFLSFLSFLSPPTLVALHPGTTT